MTTLGTTDADERLHPVEDPSPHWSDSLYFNAWDPATSTFVMTRIAVRANAAQVTAGMVVWVDGMPVYGYGHELDEIPPTDWDVMAVGDLTYRMLSSGQAWAVQLGDGDNKAHLEWQGASPATHYNGHPAGPLPRAVAWGHYEQTCRVTGDLHVGDRQIAFDGFGQRDHSWGFRHWAGLDQWHWVTGFLADGRSYNLFEVLEPDGTTTVNGFVHSGDHDTYVVGAARTLDRSDDGGAERFTLELHLDDGSELAVTGERAGFSIPVHPAPDQPVTVHETPVRVLADGIEGYGIYEHLVTAPRVTDGLEAIASWPADHRAAGWCTVDGARVTAGESDRLFALASVTKLLTATAVLVAVQEEVLSLDDPAGPPGSTVRLLLSHASGLPFDGDEPIAPPGRRRIYGNPAFELLGARLAERAGVAFPDYLREAVLEPLGMTRTELRGSPAHGGWSSVDDLLRFTAELLAPGVVLDPELLAAAIEPQLPELAGVLPGWGRYAPNPWGLGFELHDGKVPHWMPPEASPRAFGHFGQTGSFLWVDPDAGVACVGLASAPFGDWAITGWPALGRAVLAAAAAS